MTLSVVILNYNVRHFLELCIKSVVEAIANIDAEIIVIDNNSQDDSCLMVKQKFPFVTLIENKENVGFAKANNQGVKESKGEFVCILNPDTVVAEDTFVKLIEFARTKPELGAIGCKLIDGSGVYLPESKRNIPVVKVAIQKLFGNSTTYYANHLENNGIGKVDVLVGAFMFLKREVYNRVEGFDEDYFMYGEDIDLSYKLLQNGYQNYYFGEITCIHFKGESTSKDKKYNKRFHNAMKLFYKKHFKSNKLFDAFIILGINVAHFFKRNKKLQEFHPEHFYIISEFNHENLIKTLGKHVTVQKHIEHVKEYSEIIFDNQTLSYKDIIEHIENLHTQNNLSFKILPKNSNFIIGSHNSINRGKVIQFGDN